MELESNKNLQRENGVAKEYTEMARSRASANTATDATLSSAQPRGILPVMSQQQFAGQNTDALRDQYQTLLQVSESIASHRDLSALLHDLAQPLRNILQFDYVSVRLHDPERNVMRIHVLEKSAPGDLVPELPVNESLAGSVWQTQQALLFDDVDHEVRFPRAMQRLRANHIRSCCCLPLSTAHRRLGAMTIGSVREKAYQPAEFRFLEQVARQLAVAIDNALNFEQAQSAQGQLTRERDRVRLLLEVNNAVVSHLDLDDLFPAVSSCLRRVIQHDGSALVLVDLETRRYRVHVLSFAKNQSFVREGRVESDSCMKSPAAIAISTGKPAVFGEEDLKNLCSESPAVQQLIAEGVKAFCSVPLLSHDRVLGALNVGRCREDMFNPDEVELLTEVAKQIAIAVENAQAYREITELKDLLAKENLYLQDEIRTEHNFEEIVGESPALKQILEQLKTVAGTDSTILVLGETGTGKELIARALHAQSTRRDKPMIKLNCSAISAGLVESELFGHVKGAFTGATDKRMGRFELADGGTLFLDEVSELPLDTQAKLLRVLQEQEFEPVGSSRSLKVDVRVIAATNRDLLADVGSGRFRSDLFYRLNVFPIEVPALRERAEDISLLANHFMQRMARKLGKPLECIAPATLAQLNRYSWPGNIRDLQNTIERAAVLATGSELVVDWNLGPPAVRAAASAAGQTSAREAQPPPQRPAGGENQSLEAIEREHIIATLRKTRGVVEGPHGAAQLLDMNPSTVRFRMKKLSIGKADYLAD